MAIIVKGGGGLTPPSVNNETNNIESKPLGRNFVVEKKKVNGVASAEASLLVNGKQKSIGRKSHYLLDMLTLDDE